MTFRPLEGIPRGPPFAAWTRRMLPVLLILGALATGARAARRSEKQMEMDRQREEMRRQAEQKRQNPNAVLTPPVVPSRSSSVFAPLVMPPPSSALPAPPVVPGREEPPAAPGRAASSPAPDRPESAAAPRAPAADAPAPDAAAAGPPGEVVDDDLRKDASFLKGAGLFNSALELFRKYETGRDASNLATIPDLCGKAAAAFEAAGATRPGDRRIARYVEQCHGLARFARQSSLMESGTAPR